MPKEASGEAKPKAQKKKKEEPKLQDAPELLDDELLGPRPQPLPVRFPHHSSIKVGLETTCSCKSSKKPGMAVRAHIGTSKRTGVPSGGLPFHKAPQGVFFLYNELMMSHSRGCESAGEGGGAHAQGA